MNKGLYRPEYEHDACGIGALAHLKGERSHSMVDDALSVLVNLEHRGGKGLEANTGDGAGFCSKCHIGSFARRPKSVVTCYPTREITASQCCFARRKNVALQAHVESLRKDVQPKEYLCCFGARCRWTTMTLAPRREPVCLLSCRLLSLAHKTLPRE